MKVPYRKIGLFFLLLGVLLWIMNLWLDKEIYPHWPLQYEEAFRPRVNAEVILMGASHTTHGIHPKYLEKDGLRVFNFAYNGASPAFNLRWYRTVFRPHSRKPSCVIYGVHWVMFDDQFLQRRFEQDSKYFPARLFLKEIRHFDTFKTLLLNRFALIRERKQILPRLLKKKSSREVYPVSQYYHGYIPFETKRDLDQKDKANPRIDPVQVGAFEALLDEFQRDRINVLFVMMPDYIPGRESDSLRDCTALIKRISERRKIPFIDYESDRVTEINYNRDYYVDWAHLNTRGSEAFSKQLRSDFETSGFYPYCSKTPGG